MSESTNRVPTPTSVTGRRRRFTGANPYPALPQSRLPLLRGVLWVTWAAFLAILDSLRDLIPGLRGSRSATKPNVHPEAPAVSRPPRMPSLTPTG
jgi:hypothetical protein